MTPDPCADIDRSIDAVLKDISFSSVRTTSNKGRRRCVLTPAQLTDHLTRVTRPCRSEGTVIDDRGNLTAAFHPTEEGILGKTLFLPYREVVDIVERVDRLAVKAHREALSRASARYAEDPLTPSSKLMADEQEAFIERMYERPLEQIKADVETSKKKLASLDAAKHAYRSIAKRKKPTEGERLIAGRLYEDCRRKERESHAKTVEYWMSRSAPKHVILPKSQIDAVVAKLSAPAA
jgi:hypothetical protein